MRSHQRHIVLLRVDRFYQVQVIGIHCGIISDESYERIPVVLFAARTLTLYLHEHLCHVAGGNQCTLASSLAGRAGDDCSCNGF